MDSFTAGVVGTGVGLLAKTAYDYLSAKWQKEKQFEAMEKYYPVTRYPVIPDILKNSVGWKTQHKWVGYAVGEENEQYASDESILFIQDYLNGRMTKKDYIVPRNAVAVSQVYRDSFAVGTSCHDFIPKSFEPEPDAFFTYQMLLPTIQLTFYNVDGTAYLAGITYYLTPKNQKLVSEVCERTTLNAATCLGQQYPPCDRESDPIFKDLGQYGRYCNTAKKHVLVGVFKEMAHHVVLVPRKEKMFYKYCKECEEDRKNYKFVPRVVKKKAEEEAVPVAENIEQIEADEKEYEFVADAIFDNKSFN